MSKEKINRNEAGQLSIQSVFLERVVVGELTADADGELPVPGEVEEGGAGQDAVLELERGDVQHGQVDQLTHLDKLQRRELRTGELLGGHRGACRDKVQAGAGGYRQHTRDWVHASIHFAYQQSCK